MAWHPQPRTEEEELLSPAPRQRVAPSGSFSREVPRGAPAWGPALHGSRHPRCTRMGTRPPTQCLFLTKAHTCVPEPFL